MNDVFLCHARENHEVVDALCHALEDRGVKCWVAPRDIDPGVAYATSIVRAISTSRLFVLVFSEHANASPHVSRELERAVNLKVPIVPLLIEDTEPSDEIGYYISSTQWLVAHPPPLKRHLAEILETIRRGLEREDGHAPSPEPEQPIAVPAPADELDVPTPPPTATAAPHDAARTSTDPKRRRAVAVGVGAAVLVAALAVGAIAFGGGGGDNTKAQAKVKASPPTTASSPTATTPSSPPSAAGPLTAAQLRSQSVSVAPPAPGTYVMSGTHTDTGRSDADGTETQTEARDAPATMDGAPHQVVHGHQSSGSDYSGELAYEAGGVFYIRESAGDASWEWSPKSLYLALPLHVGASWTYSGEGTISDTDGVREFIKLSGQATVTDTEDVMVNGTLVAAFVIERTETYQRIRTNQSDGTSRRLLVEVNTIRQSLSPEYGLDLKSHVTTDVTESSEAYVLTDDLTLENTSPS